MHFMISGTERELLQYLKKKKMLIEGWDIYSNCIFLIIKIGHREEIS